MKDLGFNERGELEANMDEETIPSKRVDDDDEGIEMKDIRGNNNNNNYAQSRSNKSDSTLDSMDKEIEI